MSDENKIEIEVKDGSQNDGQVESPGVSEAELEAALEQAVQETGAAEQPELTRDEKLFEAEQEVLRVRAEMENFRKRMQRDSEQQLKYSYMPIMRDLLDVVDNLNRAMESAGGEQSHATALLEGVQMVSQQLSGVLSKHGCSAIESLGQDFDPNFHEAISQMPSEEHEAGKVAQEVAVGYRLHDRVVRPSNVIVSTGSATPGN